MNEDIRALSLTPKGKAACDFIFRDKPPELMADKATEIALELSEQWDGSETFLQMYQRLKAWLQEVEIDG